MTKREFHRAMDLLAPDTEMERRIADAVEMKRRPKLNWKRVVVAAAAVALLVTTAAAAAVPGLNQRLLEYLGIAQEDPKAELLAPGAIFLDVTAESNGIELHVIQVLRESRSIIVMADFTAPQGTVLDYTEEDQLLSYLSSMIPVYDETAGLLDKDGRRIEAGPGGGVWNVVDDDDLKDNHLTLMFRMEFEPDSAYMEEAVSLRLPSPKLYRFEQGGLVEAYPGDWSCVVPMPQADTRWTLRPDQAIGELDGAVITVEELYLSPATLNLTLKRDHPATVAIDRYGAVIDPEEEAAYVRWSFIGEDAERITLTTKDGRTVPVKEYTSNVYEGEQWRSYRLEEITDPVKFQGGTLTLDWASGTVTIPLDKLAPVEP